MHTSLHFYTHPCSPKNGNILLNLAKKITFVLQINSNWYKNHHLPTTFALTFAQFCPVFQTFARFYNLLQNLAHYCTLACTISTFSSISHTFIYFSTLFPCFLYYFIISQLLAQFLILSHAFSTPSKFSCNL